MTGLEAAVEIAVEICNAGFKEMYVTHSPDGEYTSSYDVIATKETPNEPATS